MRAWTLRTVFALVLPPAAVGQCLAPVVDGQSLSGSYQEGPVIQDFGVCTPQCADGYILSVPDISGVLFCFGGTFQPSTFTCTGLNCTPPSGISHGAEEEGLFNCEENWTEVPHGQVCTPKCRDGFTPDVSNLPWDPVLRKVYLPCVAGVLAPDTFTCLGSPCPIPASGNRPGEIPFANTERPCSLKLDLPTPVIPHQGFCDPLCQSGYHSNVSLIQCFAGKLATLWECLGDPCPAPSLIQYASPITCTEGPEVPHEGTCTPSCSDGYEATETALNCLTGFLIPPRFDCIALNCTSIHWIPGAVMPLPGYNLTVLRPGSDPDIVWVPQESRTCEEGPSISSGGTCTANCQPGYLPDIPHLQCQIGNFSPPTYSCIGQPCVPPNDVPDAPAVPCVEGPLISHGSNCTLTCDLGFVPSISTMMCNATELHPSNFSCIGLPCSYPTGIPNAASPACLEPLENLTHGSACTTQCLAGYVPTEPFLYCYGSLMRPSSFQCLPSSTYVDYQAPGSQIAKAWSKNMATAPLTDGFVLACHKDDFSQSMHCASILSAATLLRQGDRSSVTGVDVEIFVMQPLGPNKVMACYKLESGSTSCRSLELSGSSLVQSPEVTLNTGDTYHLALTRLSDTKSVLCFQRGLSTWICRVLIAGSSISLGTEFSVTGTLSGLAVTSPTDSQVVVCAALSDQYRATTCYLLSVSNTNSLDLVNSSLVSEGATFLTSTFFEADTTGVVLCFSDWANTSQAVCKFLQIENGNSLQEISNVTVDTAITRYLTIAPVRGDRLLLCFERQGPEEMNPCVDSRLQCQEWADEGECAINPKFMEDLCKLSCGVCTEVGPSRGQCNVLGLASGNLTRGPPVVVNRGITWNLAASKVDNETALVCFTDSTVRDAGRCRSVWAPRNWELLEARACDAAIDGSSEGTEAFCLA